MYLTYCIIYYKPVTVTVTARNLPVPNLQYTSKNIAVTTIATCFYLCDILFAKCQPQENCENTTPDLLGHEV